MTRFMDGRDTAISIVHLTGRGYQRHGGTTNRPTSDDTDLFDPSSTRDLGTLDLSGGGDFVIGSIFPAVVREHRYTLGYSTRLLNVCFN